MSEIEREEILAQRLEERQHVLDKRNLDQLLKAQAGNRGKAADDDNVSKAAKRGPVSFFVPLARSRHAEVFCRIGHHNVRGSTKEKAKKLDELKARRRAKDEKKRVCLNRSSVKLRCSIASSPPTCRRQEQIHPDWTARPLLWTWRQP